MSAKKKDKEHEEHTDEPIETVDTAAEVVADAVAEPEVVETAAEPTAEELVAAERDKYLRLAAEYDNFRKRSAKERENVFTDARADTVTKLLPVYDNLIRALATPCTDETYAKGVEMMYTQFNEILATLGVAEIPAVGEKFDPEHHNAVSQIENPDVESGVVTAEFQKGFTIGGRVIRHSVVQVSN